MFRSLITDSLCQNNLFSNLHQDGIRIHLCVCAYVCSRSLFIIFFSFVSFSFVSVVTSDRYPQLNYRRMSQLAIIHVYVELICFIFLVTFPVVLFIVLELPHTTVHQAQFASELQKSSIMDMNSMEVC